MIAAEKSAEGIVGGVIRRRPERWKRRVDTCISMEPCGRTPVFSGLCANLKGQAQPDGDAGMKALARISSAEVGRLCADVSGMSTGERGDRAILDDPT